jgi:putative FmdB family regulatory protein
MPLYEYECPQCKLRTEFIREIGATSPVTCKCGETMKKMVSAPHFTMDGKMQTLGDNPTNRKPPESSTPDGVQRAKEARQKHIRKGDVKEWAGENKKRLKHGSDIDMN